jgi:hypothetical protein
VVGRGDALSLNVESEEALGPSRLESLVCVSVGDQEPRQLISVIHGQRSDYHRAPVA